MKFSYKKFSKDFLRPIIPIGIAYKGTAFKYEVLIDSGADMCLFDTSIADALGIEVENGRLDSVTGIDGRQEQIYYHEVQITVGGWPYDMEVAFYKNLATNGHGLVGQYDFFKHFVVVFDLEKEEIELRQRAG